MNLSPAPGLPGDVPIPVSSGGYGDVGVVKLGARRRTSLSLRVRCAHSLGVGVREKHISDVTDDE